MSTISDIVSTLNAEQKSAVMCEDHNILCLAGAGTGKTHSMISRIRRLVEVDNVDPGSILVLTFTNAAAFEMRERYIKATQAKWLPEFKTFHSFCYWLLARDKEVRRALRYTDVPRIVSEEELKQIRTTAKLQSGCKLSWKQIETRTNIAEANKFTLSIYDKLVDKSLRSQNLITFDLLCKEICDLFISHHPSVKMYAAQYKHVFVDEFQDTDKTQFDFVMSLDRADKFVVGDVSQAIYGFRGADSTIIKRLYKDKSWTNISLVQNYRSTSQICEYANNIIADQGDHAVFIRSKRQGERVNIWELPDTDEFDNIRDCIDLLDKCSGKTAILCRTNSEVRHICDFLAESCRPFATSHEEDLTEKYIHAAYDPGYARIWLSSYLDGPRYASYIRRYYDSPLTDAEMYDDFYAEFSMSNPIVMLHADKIRILKGVIEDDHLTTCMKMNMVTFMFNLAEVEVEDCPEVFPETPEDLIAALPDKQVAEEPVDIYVGTIHSAKGLEYDSVILYNVGSRTFRVKDEESVNCFYVGATRAKNILHVMYSSDMEM